MFATECPQYSTRESAGSSDPESPELAHPIVLLIHDTAQKAERPADLWAAWTGVALRLQRLRLTDTLPGQAAVLEAARAEVLTDKEKRRPAQQNKWRLLMASSALLLTPSA